MVERDLSHTAFRSKCSHLVIGEVTWMVTKCTCRGVRTDNGRGTDLQGIIETTLTGMREVYHDTQTIHLPDHIGSEVRNTLQHLTLTRTS